MLEDLHAGQVPVTKTGDFSDVQVIDGTGRRHIREAIETVAAHLGNTPAICRKCYVHPQIIDAYLADELKLELRRKIGGDLKKSSLGPEERQVLNFLGRRLRS